MYTYLFKFSYKDKVLINKAVTTPIPNAILDGQVSVLLMISDMPIYIRRPIVIPYTAPIKEAGTIDALRRNRAITVPIGIVKGLRNAPIIEERNDQLFFNLFKLIMDLGN